MIPNSFLFYRLQGYKEYIQGKFQTLKRNRITIEAEIVEDSYMGGKMMKLIPLLQF